ncbi:hypothetical protein HK102_008232, partial [Quaeritorhiza haematococci]
MEDILKKYVLMQAAFDKQQNQLQLEQQMRLLEQQAAETRALQLQLQAKEDKLQKYVNKTYEEVETMGFVYLVKTDGGFKVSPTKNIDQRVGGLQTSNTEDVEVLLLSENAGSPSPSRDSPSNSSSSLDPVNLPAVAATQKIITNPDGTLIDLKDYLARELTTDQQHLFIESAWMYLNRDGECCIDLEVAMQWMGVAKKGDQKAKLKEHFTEGIDYQVLLPDRAEVKTGRGGHNKETIMLTPDAFKKLAQMSEGRGKEVRDYFIAMERVVIKYMQMQNAFMTQQLLETRLQLEEQTQALQLQLQAKEDELQTYVNKKYEEIETTGFVYLVKTDGGFKVGRTKNIDQRVGGLQTSNAEDVEVLLKFPTSDPVLLEHVIHKVLDPYRRRSKREYFECDPGYIATSLEFTGKFLDTMKSSYPCITRAELVKKLSEKLGTTFEMVPAATPKPKGPTYPHGPYRGFINNGCKPVPLEDEHGWIPVSEFYERFKTWCNENGFAEDAKLHENQVAKKFSGLVDRRNMNKA